MNPKVIRHIMSSLNGRLPNGRLFRKDWSKEMCATVKNTVIQWFLGV